MQLFSTISIKASTGPNHFEYNLNEMNALLCRYFVTLDAWLEGNICLYKQSKNNNRNHNNNNNHSTIAQLLVDADRSHSSELYQVVYSVIVWILGGQRAGLINVINGWQLHGSFGCMSGVSSTNGLALALSLSLCIFLFTRCWSEAAKRHMFETKLCASHAMEQEFWKPPPDITHLLWSKAVWINLWNRMIWRRNLCVTWLSSYFIFRRHSVCSPGWCYVQSLPSLYIGAINISFGVLITKTAKNSVLYLIETGAKDHWSQQLWLIYLCQTRRLSGDWNTIVPSRETVIVLVLRFVMPFHLGFMRNNDEGFRWCEHYIYDGYRVKTTSQTGRA